MDQNLIRRAATMVTLFAGLLLAACERSSPLAPESRHRTLQPANSNRSYSFTTIDVPGATSTTPQGIGPGGAIVGWYVAAGVTHGFLLENGEFTTIDYPGAAGTQARGIGPSGEIVGSYWLPGEPVGLAQHGFLLTRQGEFLPVDYPGHLYTIAQRILPDGTVLGCRHNEDFSSTMRGVEIFRDGTSEIDAFSSMHNGATPSGRRIVGLYTNVAAGNRLEGYIIDDGVFTPLLIPGSNLTTAWDVNPRGDVAGVYREGTVYHGYVFSAEGEVTMIDFPGASATRAFGINPGGDVVGIYVLGGVTHGFQASAKR